MIKAAGLKKYYVTDNYEVHALDGVSLSVEEGEFLAIIGTSGSGKTTLLQILGGLDEPTAGGVWIRGNSLKDMTEDERTIFRRRNIGFVFQQYNLIPVINVYENIVLPLRLDGAEIDEKLLEDMKLPFGAENLNKALLHLKLQHKDDLYVSLAKGHLDIEEVRKALKKKSENKFVKYWKLQFFKSDKDKPVPDKEKEEEKGKVINDIIDDASDFIIAPCCNPIPGDDVVGMKIDGDKITVHKRKCPEAIRLMSSYGDKIVPVKWVSHKIMSFLAVIKLNGIDSIGIVSDITMIISKESNVNMRTVHFETKDGIFEGMIHLYVHNTADLNNLMMKIASLKGVENVSRVENLDV